MANSSEWLVGLHSLLFVPYSDDSSIHLRRLPIKVPTGMTQLVAHPVGQHLRFSGQKLSPPHRCVQDVAECALFKWSWGQEPGFGGLGGPLTTSRHCKQPHWPLQHFVPGGQLEPASSHDSSGQSKSAPCTHVTKSGQNDPGTVAFSRSASLVPVLASQAETKETCVKSPMKKPSKVLNAEILT